MKITSLFIFLLIALSSAAQVKGGEMQKLFDLYALNKYDDCLYKTLKYLDKDKYVRNPEPYLYAAMCYHSIHVHSDEYEGEEFDKALKNSIKYASRFRRKDKDLAYYSQNKDFFEELVKSAAEEAKFHVIDKKYSKAASAFKRIYSFMPEDPNVHYMLSVLQIMSRNVGEGQRNLDNAIPAMEIAYSDTGLVNDFTKFIAVDAFLVYTQFQLDAKKKDDAFATISLGRKLLTDELEIKRLYTRIARL